MDKILIFGNNKISDFLHNALAEKGYTTEDITAGYKIQTGKGEQIIALIDISNATSSDLETDTEFIHNTAEIKEHIELCSKLNASYIFLYKELKDAHPEHSLITALDLVSSLGRKNNISFAKVQIEDVYGPDVNTSMRLASFIDSITDGSALEVTCDENEHYLLHQIDFLSGVLEIIGLLSKSKIGRQYTLFPEDPITEIELAHFVNELTDLNLEIEYSSDDSKSGGILETETNYPGDWYPETDLEKGIKELFEFYDIPTVDTAEAELHDERLKLSQEDLSSRTHFHEDNEGLNDPMDKSYAEVDHLESLEQLQKEDIYGYPKKPDGATARKAPKSKGAKHYKAMAVALAIIFTGISFLSSGVFTYKLTKGLSLLKEASNALANLESQKAGIIATSASETLSSLNEIPFFVKYIGLGLGIQKSDQYLYLDTSHKLAEAIISVSHSSTFSSENNQVLGASTSDTKTNLISSLNLIDDIESNLQSVKSKDSSIYNSLNEMQEILNSGKDNLSKIKNIQPVLNEIFSSSVSKKYLFITQNSSKPSPSGGEISAYALAEIKNGKFKLLEVAPVDKINDQIALNQIRILSSESLKQAVKKEFADFSDLNFEIDFQKSGKSIASTYQLVDNENVDAVITLNIHGLKKLLELTGKVESASVEGSVDGENLENTLLKSLNPSALLSEITRTVIETLGQNSIASEKLLPAVISALNDKDIIIYAKNDSTQVDLIKNLWAGTLVSGQYDDYLYAVDTDLSSSKNSNIKRSLSLTAYHPDLKSGKYERSLNISYTNNSDSEYTNYLRIAVPSNAYLNKARLTGADEEKNVTRMVDVENLGDKAVYSIAFTVPANSRATLIFDYESAKKVYEDDQIDIYIQKQPGVKNENLEVLLKYPDVSKPVTFEFTNDKEVGFPL